MGIGRRATFDTACPGRFHPFAGSFYEQAALKLGHCAENMKD
jgi:hypothetical protein